VYVLSFDRQLHEFIITPCVLRSCIYACTKSLSLAWT